MFRFDAAGNYQNTEESSEVQRHEGIPAIAVIGLPGAGKSTTLNFLNNSVAKSAHRISDTYPDVAQLGLLWEKGLVPRDYIPSYSELNYYWLYYYFQQYHVKQRALSDRDIQHIVKNYLLERISTEVRRGAAFITIERDLYDWIAWQLALDTLREDQAMQAIRDVSSFLREQGIITPLILYLKISPEEARNRREEIGVLGKYTTLGFLRKLDNAYQLLSSWLLLDQSLGIIEVIDAAGDLYGVKNRALAATIHYIEGSKIEFYEG